MNCEHLEGSGRLLIETLFQYLRCATEEYHEGVPTEIWTALYFIQNVYGRQVNKTSATAISVLFYNWLARQGDILRAVQKMYLFTEITLRQSWRCWIVGLLWTTLLFGPATCLSFVYMNSVDIANKVYLGDRCRNERRKKYILCSSYC
jgi:hypothetical protein